MNKTGLVMVDITDNPSRLSDAFPAPDSEAWVELASKALKGEPLESLESVSEDGGRIKPLYSASWALPIEGRTGGTRWDVIQRVDHPDIETANQMALMDLEGGASGLSLVVAGAPSSNGFGFSLSEETLGRLFDGVYLNMITVRLEPHPAARTSAPSLADAILRADPDTLPIVRFGLDPIGNFARYGVLAEWNQVQDRMPATILELEAKGFRGESAEADGRVYHDAGATPAQELAAILSTANAYLGLGIDPTAIGFTLAVDQDQFASMAKLRAIRLLWARVLEVWKAPAGITKIHAETSRRMMSLKDPHTNMLRTTIACFAAAVGGADSISALPYTTAHGLPNAFARRVARNTQLVLQEEANLHVVGDPAAGSGAFDTMAEDLARTSWGLFQEIEAEGGIVSSLVSGALQARIKNASEARKAALAAGETTIIGTTKFHLAEEPPIEVLEVERRGEPVFKTHASECAPLAPIEH